MGNLDISVQWRTAVIGENNEAYYFPGKFTSYFRGTYAVSGVYRWRVMRMSGEPKEPIYLGEAEDVLRRIQRVLTPHRNAKTGDTNGRLNKIFREYVAAGRKIVVDIADIEPFELNGVRFDRNGLGDRFKRRALENLLLVIAQESRGFDLLNIIVDPLDEVERLFRKLKPHEKREILRRYGACQRP